MDSPSTPPGINITVKPITSEDDIPRCAHLSDICLRPDALHEFKTRYGTKGLYEETIEKLTADLRNHPKTCRMFKAVISSPSLSDQPGAGHSEASDGGSAELIVGFTHWHYGYIEFPKMDPFAVRRQPENASGPDTSATNVAVAEAGGDEFRADTETNGDYLVAEDVARSKKTKPFYSNPDQELARKLTNAYIGAIRGKRHVYLHRLMVDPSYQRQGIGQKLLDWGIETADKENIVAWLFCRPAGYKLYERNGWKVVSSIEVDVPDEDLKVSPVVAMLRSPGRQP